MEKDIDDSMFMCVICGKKANKGSMKHPYCKKHFKEIFNDDYKKYKEYLDRTHF